MLRTSIVIVSFFAFYSTAIAVAKPTPGPAPIGEAVAYYYPASGEITVSVNTVFTWAIVSNSHGLTGDPVMNLPAAGGLVTDDDDVVGEVKLGYFSYTDLELGLIAQPYLPTGDLYILFDDFEGPVEQRDVTYIYIPEPTSLAMAGIGFCAVMLSGCRNRRSNA